MIAVVFGGSLGGALVARHDSAPAPARGGGAAAAVGRVAGEPSGSSIIRAEAEGIELRGIGRRRVLRGVAIAPKASTVVDFARLARRFGRSRRHRARAGVAVPAPRRQHERRARRRAPAAAGAQRFRALAPSPSPTQTFAGLPDDPAVGTPYSYIPPDTNGAAGPMKLMTTLNNNYGVQNRADGTVASVVSMNDFWASTGASDFFDPRTYFDPYNGRWILVAAADALSADSSIVVGVSATSDPSGSFSLYRIDADPGDGSWADYPTVGFNKNWIAIGVNMFTNTTRAYSGSKVFVLDYPTLRAGSLAGSAFDVPSFTVEPAVTYSPSQETLYMVAHRSSTAATYDFYSVTGAPASPTVTFAGTKTNPLGGWIQPQANMIPQAGGTGLISANDARILNAVYRNGGIYYAQTVALGAGAATHTAAQWVELSTAGDVVQAGRIQDSTATLSNGGHWYAFPSIAVNKANDVVVGFSEFQSNDFADAGYAVHAAGDPAGTMRDPVTLKDGEAYYFEDFGTGINRWGDYSATQVDPANDLDVWTLEEYAAPPSLGRSKWGTWWGRISFDDRTLLCVVPNVQGQPLSNAQALLDAGGCAAGAITRSFSATVPAGSVISQGVAAGTTLPGGSGVDLVVSDGAPPPPPPPPPPVTCLVPDVHGRALAAAVTSLKTAHCAPGVIRRAFSRTVPAGNVISQAIPAGAQLANGSTIDLLVSKGRAPKKPPATVTLCYHHRTVKVTKAVAKKLRKHGAKLGPCRNTKKKR